MRAGGSEFHVGTAVMNFQPAPLNGKLQAGAVFSGRALVVEQEGAVEFLDVYPAILNWLEGVCVLQQTSGRFFRIGKWAVGCQFQIKVSRFPMLGEWHGGGSSVMPVRHDMHRTRGAAFLADEAPCDCRPRQVLGQGVQSDIDHASVARTARTLDVAGHMTVGDPFRRSVKRVIVG